MDSKHSVEHNVALNDLLNRGGSIVSVQTKAGSYQYYYDDQHKNIYLVHVQSNHKANGFGTQVMQEMVQKSIDNKCEGNVKLEAAWSSHIFYLFMGMLPEERFTPYVTHQYGDVSQWTLEEFKTNVFDEDDLVYFDEFKKAKIINILRDEKNIPKSTEITDNMIFKNKEFLLNLMQRTVSYISNTFMHHLLDVFENHIRSKNKEKYPSTDSFLAIKMVFSKEGKERWLECVKQDKPFVPFKKLEHLIPYMNDKDKMRWEVICQKLFGKEEIKNTKGPSLA